MVLRSTDGPLGSFWSQLHLVLSSSQLYTLTDLVERFRGASKTDALGWLFRLDAMTLKVTVLCNVPPAPPSVRRCLFVCSVSIA